MVKKKALRMLLPTLLAILTVLTVVIAGCAPAAAPTPTEKVYEWRMTGWQPRGTLVGDEMAEFCELVTKMSGGRIQLMATFGGEVMTQAETFDGLASGVCEVGTPWPGFYTGTVPEAMIEVGLPFSLKSPTEQQTLILERGWGDILREVYAEHNIYWLGDFVQPEPHTMFKEPIESLADLEGRKLRAPGGPVATTLEACGAKIVMLPVAELYTALMTGTVDGFSDGHFGMIYDLKLYEFAKYTMVPDVGMLIGPVVVNMDAWNSLPEDLQLILQAAFQSYARTIETREGGYCTEKWSEMEKLGCEKCYLPESDYPKLREIADEIWADAAAASPRCAQMVEILKDYMIELGYLE